MSSGLPWAVRAQPSRQCHAYEEPGITPGSVVAGVRGGSADPGPSVVDAHVGADTDAAQVVLGHGGGTAVIHAHIHVVAVTLDAVLDGVAGDRAGHCARNGRGVLATLAFGIGELAPGRGPHQAAEDGTGGIGHVAAATDLFEPGDGAAVVARGGGAIARRRGAV